jgi:glucan-binding YG repeat protein
MRRISSWVFTALLSVVCLVVAPTFAFADENLAEEKDVVDKYGEASPSEYVDVSPSEEQIRLALEDFKLRELGEPYEVAVLYSHDEAPRYILAVSEKGYLIADTLLGSVCEWGRNQDPYAGYENIKRYYGGFGLYYCLEDVELFDIERQESVVDIMYIPTREELSQDEGFAELFGQDIFQDEEYTGYLGQDGTEGSLAPLAQASVNAIPSVYAYVQRLSFGRNESGQTFEATCTAVATGQALNYLDWMVDDSIVPSAFEAETLTSNIWQNYSHTTALQTYLVNDCSMPPVTYANGVKDGLEHYQNYGSSVASTGIAVSWTFAVTYNYITSQIDKGLPAMMTTVFGVGTDAYGQSYDTHSMLVVGYQTQSSGAQELLVHSGWYGNNYIDQNLTHRVTYVNASIAIYAYKFTFNPGWHKNKQGEWRHFNSDGSYKTGRYYLPDTNGQNYWFSFDSSNGAMQTNTWLTVPQYQDPDRTPKLKVYFGSDGRAVSGLQKIGGWKYYFADSTADYIGAMSTGWQVIDGAYHYFGGAGDGKMRLGWQEISGYWHYFEPQNESGRMQVNQWIDPGRAGNTCASWAYVGSDGRAKTGWHYLPDTGGSFWYYFSAAGNMQTGWLYYDGGWYYLRTYSNYPSTGPSGSMVTGWQWVSESSGVSYWFYFNGGRMVVNTVVADSGGNCYLKSNGRAAQSETIYIVPWSQSRWVNSSYHIT